MSINVKMEMKDLREAEPGFLLGTLVINGASHHAEFIRVATVDNHQRVLPEDDEDNESRYEDIQQCYPGYYPTMKIEGQDGEWVCHVFPHNQH